MQGDLYDSREHLLSGGIANSSGANLLGRWTRILSDESDFSLQSYVDRTHLADPVAPLIVAGLQFSPAGTAYDDLTTYDVDFQHRFRLASRNRVVWGLGFRRTQDAVLDAPALGFVPGNLDQNLYSLFVQDEIELRKNLSLIAGRSSNTTPIPDSNSNPTCA